MFNFILFLNESHRHNVNGDIFAVYIRNAWVGMDRLLNRLVRIITLSILFRRMAYILRGIKSFVSHSLFIFLNCISKFTAFDLFLTFLHIRSSF